ncbi:nucleotide excision repair endonuclease [Fodinibius salsisoli]|uniref:Excinuclease cho n=1 Tax=Fodinibius salsisoli TaxID=2820877 RepID=A0ABT3PQD9_9BACT|nr:nucleotide excision repair endonuclease [Fodinibius salsisoli]MCW9708074.1 nucleotide excision repair endonuclease [Fodinibius salsisoli]
MIKKQGKEIGNQSVMSDSEQHQLFEPAENPLEERLGKAFFEDLPTTPGVYKMYGQSGRLLYVGKAKNLRNRLFTYRRVKSSHSSRKVKRLVQMIRHIELQHCESEEEALLTENRLIRNKKPEFNRAKKSPDTYYFLILRPEENQLTFRLSMQHPEDKSILSYTYGAFKGHRTIRKGTGALLRQLYLAEHDIQTPFQFPTVLTNNLTPLSYELPLGNELVITTAFQEEVENFLSGKSTVFIEKIVEVATNRNLLTEYIGRLILKDCESLKYFYKQCLHRNWQLQQTLELEERLIPQGKLDDYLIKAAFKEG